MKTRLMGLCLAGAAILWSGASFAQDEPDMDNDGYTADVDCDDEDETVHPLAAPQCGELRDYDCDGDLDPVDCDFDGYENDEDCDDTRGYIFPGAPESEWNDECEPGSDDVDYDCDGVTEVCLGPRPRSSDDGGAVPLANVVSALLLGLWLGGSAWRRRRRS